MLKVVPHTLKIDILILCVAILLQQVHPVLTLLCFIIILIRDLVRNKFCMALDLPTLFITISLIVFLFIGVNSGNVSLKNAIWYTVPSMCAIFIGYNFSYKFNSQQYILYLLFLISLFLALPHIIVTGIDILQTGLVNPERTLSIYGDSDTQRSVTGRTVELSLAICGISLIFSKSKNLQIIKKYYIYLAIIAELCTLHYLSRTGIFLFLIALAIGFLSYAKLNNKTIGIIVLLIIFFLIFISSNLFSLFAEREIEGSSISDAGGRTERWVDGFSLLIQNPRGYVIEDWYAHNFWLDFGAAGGLISFFLLSIYSIIILVKSFLLNKTTYLEKNSCFILKLVEIIFFLTLFTEPVHSGAPAYMYMYFMISGFVNGVSKKCNIQNKTLLSRKSG